MPVQKRPAGPLTHEEVREQLDYDPETGILIWKVRKPRIYPGRRAGNPGVRGYRQIVVCGFCLIEHILIWFWMTGKWPDEKIQIDHKNLIRDDNRWENLRESTQGQNQSNSLRYGPMRGIKAVYKAGGRINYRVRIANHPTNGRIHLGYFDTLEEAIAVRDQAMKDAFGEFARIPEME